MVRPYERGDSLRSISWRQTAHHGRLMSFETEPAGNSVTALLVDTTVTGHDDALAAAAAASFATLRARGEHPLMTDGVATATEESQARLFTAALHSAGSGDDPDGTAYALAKGALHIASAGRRSVNRAVVITTEPNGRLVRAAREAFRGCEVLTIAVPSTPDDRVATVTATKREKGADAPADKANARKDSRSYPASAALASAACCIASLVATILVLSTLIEPAGWTPFALTVLSLVALDATALGQISFLQRHRLVRALLTGILLVAILCAGAVRAVELVGLSSLDLLDVLFAWPQATATGEPFAGPLIPLASILVGGVFDLIVGKWVPVSVSPTSDAALVLIMALAACLLRALLASRHLRPFLAALPCGLLAIRLLFMGTSDRSTWFALIPASMLLLVALIRPRRNWIASTLPVTCVAVALSCALTPQAFSLAKRIPIDLNISPEALDTSAVSPLVDLRKELVRGKNTTALIYTTNADHPLYLRLSTLISFDGNTWETGSQTDGPLDMLSGLFSRTAPDASLGEDSPDSSPLMLAGELGRLGTGPVEALDTVVTIRQLSTSYLPIPTGTFSLEREGGYLDEGTWRWDADGSLNGGSASTEPGMSYRVRSAYLDPITRPTQLQQLETLNASLATAIKGENRSAVRDHLPDRAYRDLPGRLPQAVNDIVDAARNEGVDAGSPSQALEQLEQQLDAMRYLLSVFTDGSFSYTLDTPDDDAPDNLAAIGSFLERKSGWCVHYASSLAVLGRAMGLSTRIALGYRAQSDSAATEPYRATSHDLHTWTEVYLTGIGWVPFDVTPGVGGGEPAGRDEGPNGNSADEESPSQPDGTNEPTDDTKNESDSQSTGTPEQSDGAVDGDRATGDPLAAFTAAVASLWAAMGAWLHDTGPYLLGTVLAIAILIAPSTIRSHRTKRRLAAVRERAPHAAQAAWDEMTDTARDVGIDWPKSATEEDVAHIIAARIGAAPTSQAARDIEQMATAVCEQRYAPAGTQGTVDAPPVEVLQHVLIALANMRADTSTDPNSTKREHPGTTESGRHALAALRRFTRAVFPRSVFPPRR